MNPSAIIEALGGTFRVAELCEVRPPSVSDWKKNGIPRARLMFLRVIRPDVFRELDGNHCEEAPPTMTQTIPPTATPRSSTGVAVNPSSTAQASP